MTARYVALIRHGDYHQKSDVPSALQPYPLTDKGRTQASRCGEEILDILARQDWSLNPSLHCSPQLRAWETAQVAGRVLKSAGHVVEIAQSPALSERSVGSAANLTLAQIERILTADPRHDAPPAGWKSDSDYCLPFQGAESLETAGVRVADHIRRIVTGNPQSAAPQLTLFFGHGASFRHAACKFGVLAREMVPRLSMYHARPLLLCYNPPDRWSHFGGCWKRRSLSEQHTD